MSWTVAELIEELSKRPQDLEVQLTDGSALVGVGQTETALRLYFGQAVVLTLARGKHEPQERERDAEGLRTLARIHGHGRIVRDFPKEPDTS